MMPAQKTLFLLAILLLSSCGAPIKSADSVSHIFQDSKQLDEKVSALCTFLNQRQEQPNLTGMTLAPKFCTSAMTQSLDYDSLKDSLGFSLVESVKQAGQALGIGPQDNFVIKTVAETSLNRSIIQLAQIVFNQLKKETDSVLASSGGGSAPNKSFDFKIIGKPDFDPKNFSFKMEFSLVSKREQNGNIDMDNTFRVAGLLFENKYFAATAETTGDQPVEKSLLRRGKFAIFVIPHGGRVFVQISTDMVFYSFGVDNAMESQLKDALGKGLKAIPDLFAKLDQNSK